MIESDPSGKDKVKRTIIEEKRYRTWWSSRRTDTKEFKNKRIEKILTRDSIRNIYQDGLFFLL